MSSAISIPEVGQAAKIRNRLGVIRAVQAYDTRSSQGQLHLVEVEYFDDYKYPEIDQVLWELEKTAEIIGATSLPRLAEDRPDNPQVLKAFINSHKWTRLNRLRESSEIKEEPILSIWNSAIQVHAYQLEPVLKALEMPRVSLLLADGVGLGKTIQAGLVLEELLLRRRIRRVLVICPALLQTQWQTELKRKFNIDFEIIDTDSIFKLRRRMGIDTNPWKAYPRVITSMDYLRQPDVLQQFLQSTKASIGFGRNTSDNGPHAPWDLLIVDECHNFSPLGSGRSSLRTKMLRDIRFLFEHRLFLSATPHNGKTISFTGLLELLDPVRFQLKANLTEADKTNLNSVRIRRLKSDINKSTLVSPFADQKPPEEIKVVFEDTEIELFRALREYRKASLSMLRSSSRPGEKWVTSFIFSILTKRLLSCPFAFARTWWRHIDKEKTVDSDQLFLLARNSSRRASDEFKNDSEKSVAEEDASRFGGAWLRQRISEIQEHVEDISKLLESSGYGRDAVGFGESLLSPNSISDSKTDRLVAWIKSNLCKNGGGLRDDERLIVFTEYKETLHFLEQRLRAEEMGFDHNTLNLLYGGMTAQEFQSVQSSFEDPSSPVRLLLATDAASEGINMQNCCRWVLHYDIPWSPTKLQQRNGRVSRFGQLRDVHTFYFRSDQDEDVDFLFRVAAKVDQVKEDLGSVEHVFAATLQQHMEGQGIDQDDFDILIEREKRGSAEYQELGKSSSNDIQEIDRRARELLESTQRRMEISSDALRGVLESALTVEGHGSLTEIKDRLGFYRLDPPPTWEEVVRKSLMFGLHADRMEIAFDQSVAEEEHNGRRFLMLRKNQVLLRLSHPVMKQAISILNRGLYSPTGKQPINRWTIGCIKQSGFEALLKFHYILTAINDLRESAHDEVFTGVFRVLGADLDYIEDEEYRELIKSERVLEIVNEDHRNQRILAVRQHWDAHQESLEHFIEERREQAERQFAQIAAKALQRDKETIKADYDQRLKELSDSTTEAELRRLRKALADVEVERIQYYLLEEFEIDVEQKAQVIEQDIALLKRDVEQTRDMIRDEKKHILDEVLPRRYKIQEVRILPLAVEYIFPATAEDLR